MVLTARKVDIATQLLLHEVHHRAQAMSGAQQYDAHAARLREHRSGSVADFVGLS